MRLYKNIDEEISKMSDAYIQKQIDYFNSNGDLKMIEIDGQEFDRIEQDCVEYCKENPCPFRKEKKLFGITFSLNFLDISSKYVMGLQERDYSAPFIFAFKTERLKNLMNGHTKWEKGGIYPKQFTGEIVTPND